MEADSSPSEMRRPSRRRFLAVSAAAGGLALSSPALGGVRRVSWRGIALGAEAQIQLVQSDQGDAEDVLHACIAEIDRLENIFSLYRPDSTISRLNKSGVVEVPELEFVDLLAVARQLFLDTEGAFDVTVQPVWAAHASGAPSQDDLEKALDLVGFDRVEISSERVRLSRAGMSLTLNGIAQGYITDRVTAFLRQSGYQNVLVHLGETYGAGHKSSGQPWRALIDGTEERIDLTDYALATSGSPAGSSITHLFDPGTARTASLYNTVSVTAPTAMLADGLSTAFHFLDTNQIQRVLSTYQRVSAVLVDRSGHILKQLGVNG